MFPLNLGSKQAARADVPMKCTRCGNEKIRNSRLQKGEGLRTLLLQAPFRCSQCNYRFWVQNHFGRAILLTGITLVALLWVALESHLTSTQHITDNLQIKQEYLFISEYLKGEKRREEREKKKEIEPRKRETNHEVETHKNNKTLDVDLNYFSRTQIINDQTKNPETVQSYKDQAEKGNIYAQYKLGLLYLVGHGILQDYEEAVKWLNLASEKGFAPAQYELGLIYRAGTGVSVDYALSYVWLNLAAAAGIEAAATIRDKMMHALSPQQLAQAQKTSRDWLKSRVSPESSRIYMWSPRGHEGNESWVRS